MNTILVNGKVLLENGTFAEAIAIENGLISAIGSNVEISALKDDATDIIDARGNLVLPGLNDSHLHFHNLGSFLASLNLYGVSSIKEIIAKSKDFIASRTFEPNQAVVGRGWNQDYFSDEKRLLNRHDLDQISTEYPLIFKRACGHVTVCNTRALELAGITSATPQVEGGVFEIGDDGEPNGVFNENAMRLVDGLLPEASLESVKEKILVAAQHAISNGLTSVQTNDLNYGTAEYPYMIQAYQELAAANQLPIRVYLQCTFSEPTGFQSFIDQGYYTGYGDDRFKIGPLKMFVDGSLGARTALMRKPYHDDASTCGVECLTQDQLNTMVKLADDNKFQVMVHAIGDEAICRVLTSYENVYNPDTNNPLRHGINHCQITDIPMLERFRDSNVIAFVQPIFLHYDLHIVADRVGDELASTSYAFNTMEELGIHTAYGTDAPVEDLKPFECIYCAVTRKDLTGNPSNGYYPNECVSIEKAIERYTIGSAYASSEEDIKGTLEVGKLADLVVVDKDLFTIDDDEIKNTHVVLTMVGGEVVYTNDSIA